MARADPPSLSRLPISETDSTADKKIPDTWIRFVRATSRDRAALEPTREIDSVQPPNLSISKTVDEVIIHHADRLHVRINNGRTNEAEVDAVVP